VITVDIFAGAVSIGSLATLPVGFPNGAFITRLLAIASLVFTTSLFITFAILYVLRAEARDTPPSRRRAAMCTLLLYTAFSVMFGGFVVLNIVLIAGGQGVVGYTGIAMLCGIPVWLIVYSRLERMGLFEDPPRETPVTQSTVEKLPAAESSVEQPPLAKNPIYHTNKHFLV
jgi:hypothetical protein